MTSFTTIIVILILFLFGGGSIKGFAFALLIGIVVGTYSSIFIAAPVLHDLGSDLKVNRRIADKPVKTEEGKSFARSAK
jgi:SecD/SecF fusion protein